MPGRSTRLAVALSLTLCTAVQRVRLRATARRVLLPGMAFLVKRDEIPQALI